MLFRKWLWVFVVVSLLLPATTPIASAENDAHGGLFQWISGTNTHPNTLPTGNLEAGDLLFGWNPGCSYGEWSHVMMVAHVNGALRIVHSIGGAQSIQHHPLTWVNQHYNVAASVRANLSAVQRNQAAQRGVWFMNNSNGPYDWNSPVNQSSSWQCAKFVYRAYLDAVNVNLWHRYSFWTIYPGSIYGGPHLSVVSRTSMINAPPTPWVPPGGGGDQHSFPIENLEVAPTCTGN